MRARRTAVASRAERFTGGIIRFKTRFVKQSSPRTDLTHERGSKFLSGFFDGKEFAYGGLRNPSFSLRHWHFLTNAYGAYGGNVENPNSRGLWRNMRNDFAYGSLRNPHVCLRQAPYRHSLKDSPLQDFDLCSSKWLGTVHVQLLAWPCTAVCASR